MLNVLRTPLLADSGLPITKKEEMFAASHHPYPHKFLNLWDLLFVDCRFQMNMLVS
jgi:hypothetical protein